MILRSENLNSTRGWSIARPLLGQEVIGEDGGRVWQNMWAKRTDAMIEAWVAKIQERKWWEDAWKCVTV